jgi:NDP-sugar pyrophosphorylase family protein
MKTLLICPDKRESVAALAEEAPLSNLSILGKPLIEHWLDCVSLAGAKEVLVLATDRSDQVKALVGNGSRWGLRVTVQSEVRELTPAEARKKYRSKDEAWLREPWDAISINHLPGLSEFPLFTNYAIWFAVVQAFLPSAATPLRIGVREIKPGVWVSLRANIAPDVRLIAPCWIGDNVCVREGAVIGPRTVLDNMSFVERGAEISDSYVAPATLVGEFLELRNSIALGSTLIDWKSNSLVKVPEEFLLCSLTRPGELLPLPQIARRASLALTNWASRGARLAEQVSRVLLLRPLKADPFTNNETPAA